ncbi:HNH endonuclease [Methylobacter tundripaludum]|uniref:HNH endonuclease n=1 Tax=Methylobacter tundripaludum TaxID=173365 RepID=A0A2S6HIZ6_9GAMM|nr:HNH endonuclease signature motif containing protein [Methylobacter tundripaludum]PPK77426.1 HNH endonuclease [Methylobacter tundripaludum]
MPFPREVRDIALVKSHRRCCVCHEFGGRNVNVHHIIQEADGGVNALENAICLCLRCHAEAGHFNSRHPLGTKYSPRELKAHRDQWWEHCLSHPEEPLGLFLDVRFKAISRTAEIHRYRLIATYTNTMNEAQDSWKLKICFPAFVPLSADDYDRDEIRIEGKAYVQLESSSNDRIFPGESVDIVPLKTHFIEYEVNDSVYDQLREQHKVSWKLYTSNAQVIEGDKPLSELQEF